MLNITFQLINENKLPTVEIKKEVKNEDIKSFLLYLFIDHASKLKIMPNLFLTYKTFPELERITTDVIWNYKDSFPINHKMVTAVMGTETISNKLSNTSMVIELWNKASNGQEELIGITKLPLQLFSSYVTSGDSLANSVYPIIAFDEYRPVNNIKTGEEIGYVKLCLAMGTSAQVNRLRQTHDSSIKPLITTSFPDFEIEQNKIEFFEKSVQISERKPAEIFTQSVDSIGDIATLLNQKNYQESPGEIKFETPAEFKPRYEEIQENLKSSPRNFKTPEAVIENIPSPVENSPEIVIELLKSSLLSESINLQEELKIADRFNYGYMHKESLAYFLNELRLGISPLDISTFIEHLLETHSSSNARRVLFTDILSTLDLIQPSYTKHTFTLIINSIFACQCLSRLSNSQVYIKYQFPTESNYIETDLLDPEPSIQINLKSLHSCTFPKSSSLTQCFSDNLEGISIYLCRRESKGEEKVIGKGLLPIEEITELENNSKLNRVICLYGDNIENLQIHRNELIGKVRISIEYNTNFTYQAIDSSGELLFEKHTQIDRKIPRNNLLAVMLESYAELNRGIKYIKSLGLEIFNSSQLFFYISLFHEDKELALEYSDLLIAKTSVKDKENLSALKSLDLKMSQKVLEYFNHKSGLLSLYFDKDLIGTCKVPLLSLLLHSTVKGEYPLLNEFGQFMGIVSLTLSFSMDDFLPTKPVLSETPSSKFHITIESALNLLSELDGEYPNTFVQFT